jgi:hypothetical protein
VLSGLRVRDDQDASVSTRQSFAQVHFCRSENVREMSRGEPQPIVTRAGECDIHCAEFCWINYDAKQISVGKAPSGSIAVFIEIWSVAPKHLWTLQSCAPEGTLAR